MGCVFEIMINLLISNQNKFYYLVKINKKKNDEWWISFKKNKKNQQKFKIETSPKHACLDKILEITRVIFKINEKSYKKNKK